MTGNVLAGVILLALSAAGLYWLCMRYNPQQAHARWLRRGVSGFLMLMAWNLLPLPHLGVNVLSVLLTGSLGVPGLGLMAVINALP